jgi:hypothetical protein
MQDTKFWRIVAVVVCVGILYVGHGLHNRGGDGVPSLVNTAYAGGVAAAAPGPFQYVYTASEDGRVLYLWKTDVDGNAKSAGTAAVDEGARPNARLPFPVERSRSPFWYDARDPVKPPSLQNKEGRDKPAAK